MKAPRLALSPLAAVTLAAALSGQVTPNRWGSVKSFTFGEVDRSMLSNDFAIPIYTRPTVGNARIGLVLTYKSNFWSGTGPGNGFGWMLTEPFGTLNSSQYTYNQYCGWWNNTTDQYDQWYNLVVDSYTFTEPDGTAPNPAGGTATSEYLANGGGRRQRGDEYNCPAVSGRGNVLIPDGKGYTIVVYNLNQASAYAHVFDRHGDQVDGLLKDPNGNQVTVTTASGDTYYHDPLGNDPSGNPALIESGSGTQSSPLVFTYTGPSGSQTSITERFAPQSISSPACGNWTGSPQLPTELDLPDGRKYTFGYDSAGRVTSVTLPTGATVNYSYTADCSDGGNSAFSRWESIDGQAHAWGWSRTQQGGGAVQTTETSPDQNDSVFSFAAPYWKGESGALTEADFYSGSGGGRTEVESLTANNTLTDNYVTGQGLTDILFSGSPAQAALWRQEIFSYTNSGDPLYVYDYDWGTCATCGAILCNVTTAYTSLLAGNVMEVPSQVTVSPNTGSGGQISQINYSYDSSTGNLTGIQEYVSSSTNLSKGFSYNANGTVATATDTNGGITTYTYGNAAAGGCTDVNGNGVFPTIIQSPVTAVKTTETWNCTGGVMLSSTDGNSQTITTAYADSSNTWRPSSVKDASGSIAYLTYPTAANPGASERTLTFNGGNSTADLLITLDGLGRDATAQRKQSPSASNYDTVSTFYDAMDRPVRVTMPCSQPAGQGCADAAPETVTTYDALSRPLVVSDGGGGTVSYTYTLNDTLIAVGPAPSNENLKQKQEESDGLGRLESVCELTGTANGGGTCGQTNALTGYWTKYTRDALSDITAVTQNAQGSTTESRSFAFDWLGRMTQEVNPESGSTSYALDSDPTCGTSKGDLVKRVDASGNVTCYGYDALHRVTEISYSVVGGFAATPTKTFVYDAATVDGTAMANVVGKLAEAYTGSRSTDLGFSFPNPGANEEDVYQSSPNSGGWYISTQQHYANGAPSALTLPTAVPAITYGLDGEGRPATVSAGSGQNPVTAAGYSALGLTALTLGSGDSDAYSYDNNTGRMTKYQLTVGGSTDTGTVGWNPNGTRSSLGIADPIPGATDNGISCNYAHDDLGRLLEANCGGAYDEKFSWDPFGNHNSGNTPSGLVTSFSFSNNQIAGASYDADGNLTADPLLPSQTNAFDAEGHAVTLEGVSVVYDALGRAVEGAGQEIVYAPDGRKIAVMSGQSLVRADIPLPGGGEAVYGASGLAYYRHADGLGSAVISSTPSGTLASSTHYTPFGFDDTGAGAGYRSFSGQKQDIDFTHSGGQYDFLMREYNPIQGRWWTPDPAGLAAVDPNEPQSWNRYSYVNGTPLSAVDPLGLLTHCPVDPVSGEPVCPDPDPGNPGGGGGGSGGGGGGGKPSCLPTEFVFGGLYPPMCDGGGGAHGPRPRPSPPVAPAPPNIPNATIGPYQPPALECAAEAAAQAGLDFFGLSIIANQDDWRWNSATMSFYYVGGNALVSVGASDAVGAVGTAAKDVAGSKAAQRGIKQFLIDLGATTTMKEISSVAGRVGRITAAANALLATYDAVNRFQSCRN